MYMPEPRNDMFPDQSQTDPELENDPIIPENPPKPAVVEPPVNPQVPEPPKVPKEIKTPANELYAALEQERSKRKALELKIEQLTTSPSPSQIDDELLSDEGKILKAQIEEANVKISALTNQLAIKDLLVEYPELKDRQSEFETFKADYPGVAIDKLAKLFLNENNSGTPTKPRRGLEKPTGGPKVIEPEGYTAAQIDALRSNQPRLFAKLIREGKIDPEKIH